MADEILPSVGAMIAMGIFLFIVTIICRLLQVRQEKQEAVLAERQHPSDLKFSE